jgi:hypothetical protein
LLVSLSPTANAKPKTNFPMNLGTSGSGARVVNAKEAKRILIRLISRKGKGNAAANLSAPCTCAAAQDWGSFGFGGCFRSCMTSWGVSYGSLITCGGVCALAMTANPIAIGVCAACVGTGEWVVAGCVLNCVGGGGRWGYLEEAKSRRARTRGSQQAKLNVKRVTSG